MPAATRRRQRRRHPALAQPAQIGDRALGAGQHDRGRTFELGGHGRVTHVDVRLVGQRVEVRVVADERQPHDGDLQRRIRPGPAPPVLDAQRVLLVAAPVGEHGHDAQGRNARLLLQELDAGVEQRRIPAELVDDERRDQLALLGREQLHVADQTGEDAAAVDVADEQRGRLRIARHLHVDDVLAAQVDLGRAAGALDDDEVVGGAQPVVGGGDDRPDLRLVGVVLAHRHVADGTAEHDDLAAGL